VVHGLDRASPPAAGVAKAMLDRIGGSWWNVYIGGPRASVTWTPAQVDAYRDQGIRHFLLTYVGRQQHDVPLLTAAQGAADGDDACRRAESFGFGAGAPLCLDVELPTFEIAPTGSIDYAAAWCKAVRARGLRPGVYANVNPLLALAERADKPDWVWVARWLVDTPLPNPGADPADIRGLTADMWTGRRVWQYAGERQLGHLDPDFEGITVDLNVTTAGAGSLTGTTADGLGSAAAALQLLRTNREDDMFTFTTDSKPVFFVAGGKAVGLNSLNDLRTIRSAVKDLPHFHLDAATFEEFLRTYRE
jgi:hypothetical protein